MKKILTLFVLFLSLSISSYAQESTETQIKAKNLAIKIKDYLNLDSEKTKAVYEIIDHKSTMLQSEQNLIDERRQLIINKFTKKLEGTLSPDEFKRLKLNNSLFTEFEQI